MVRDDISYTEAMERLRTPSDVMRYRNAIVVLANGMRTEPAPTDPDEQA